MRRGPVSTRYAPVLVYLVEMYPRGSGIYVHPKGHGYVSGQTAWSDPKLWVSIDKARELIKAHPGAQLVKLRVYAQREAIKRSNKPDLSDVPANGREAWEHGWGAEANPHKPDPGEPVLARMRWMADWHQANADGFADWLKDHPEGTL